MDIFFNDFTSYPNPYIHCTSTFGVILSLRRRSSLFISLLLKVQVLLPSSLFLLHRPHHITSLVQTISHTPTLLSLKSLSITVNNWMLNNCIMLYLHLVHILCLNVGVGMLILCHEFHFLMAKVWVVVEKFAPIYPHAMCVAHRYCKTTSPLWNLLAIVFSIWPKGRCNFSVNFSINKNSTFFILTTPKHLRWQWIGILQIPIVFYGYLLQWFHLLS